VEEEEAATEKKMRRKIIGIIKAGSVRSRESEVTKCISKFVVTIQYLLCLQSSNC